MGVPNESFPPQSWLTPSPPGGLYNLPAPTSVPHFTQAGGMLLLPVLLAASCWSRKPRSLSPLLPLCGEPSPCSRLQTFRALTKFSPNFSPFPSRWRCAGSASANAGDADSGRGPLGQHGMPADERRHRALVQAASWAADQENTVRVGTDTFI